MLIKVVGFGINWWSRSRESVDREHAAFYNSTGIRCGGKIRRHWLIPGLVRVNGVADFDIAQPERTVGQTFICSDLSYSCGGNRLLLKSRTKCLLPDAYLVALSSQKHGRIDPGSKAWKSVFASVIALSELRDMQEVMLLMRAGDWIQTTKGFWQLHCSRPRNVELVLVGPHIEEGNS